MDNASGTPSRALSDLITLVSEHGVPGLLAIHGLERLELLRWSDAMVEAYGKVFQKHKAIVMDKGLLPCPKSDLRVALKVQFQNFALKQDVEAMEDLARAYLNLSRFQPITPADKIMLEELNLHAVPMMDIDAGAAQGGTITEQEQRFMDCFRTFQAYLGMVENEKAVLRQDIDTFVRVLLGPGEAKNPSV
ncbi:MAG: hypothetical protein ABFD81_18525 [Syntrophaceae bacterium]